MGSSNFSASARVASSGCVDAPWWWGDSHGLSAGRRELEGNSYATGGIERRTSIGSASISPACSYSGTAASGRREVSQCITHPMRFFLIPTEMNPLDNGQIGRLNMKVGGSTNVKRRRGQGRCAEMSRIETVGSELRVWRDQYTNEIVVESPYLAPGMLCDGLISLSARHARHLAHSLLLFAAEAESSSILNAAPSAIQVAQNE
jgi:hypothetical protein